MQIKANWRDIYPKMALGGAYLGDGASHGTELARLLRGMSVQPSTNGLKPTDESRDVRPMLAGYPLCTEMPSKAFLRSGARYVFLGGDPSPRVQEDESTQVTSWLTLNAATSALYQVLCTPAASSGACTYQSEVTLSSKAIFLHGHWE